MNIDKNALFFFDAEWVPIAGTYEDLKINFPNHYIAWENKCKKWNKELEENGKHEKLSYILWEEKAHWYPEFLKMVCISFGYYNEGILITKSVYGHDERELLEKFQFVLNKVQTKGFILCGVSIARFDMPFIAKRMMVNGLVPPTNLNVYGIKPWDVRIFDITEVWGQGCKGESYTPFEWICVSLGIDSPKDDISGADVARVYYEEYDDGLERIKTYCEKDVMQTVKVAEKLIDLNK